jgi:hypothetical protein
LIFLVDFFGFDFDFQNFSAFVSTAKSAGMMRTDSFFALGANGELARL